MKMTRKEYMSNSGELHREYYGQFVNEQVKKMVIREIGMDYLKMSRDEHLNDIPLKMWDSMSGFVFRGSEMVMKPSNIEPIEYAKLKEAGEGVSCATLVCIYKEAAKQIIESL
jgi:hypothetical protein